MWQTLRLRSQQLWTCWKVTAASNSQNPMRQWNGHRRAFDSSIDQASCIKPQHILPELVTCVASPTLTFEKWPLSLYRVWNAKVLSRTIMKLDLASTDCQVRCETTSPDLHHSLPTLVSTPGRYIAWKYLRVNGTLFISQNEWFILKTKRTLPPARTMYRRTSTR